MLTDNLMRFVTLKAPSTLVPTGNVAAFVEHENGVIFNAFHEQPEFLLLFEPRIFRGFTLGEIAGDFSKAYVRAVVIAKRGDNDVRPKSGSVFSYPEALFFIAPI